MTRFFIFLFVILATCQSVSQAASPAREVEQWLDLRDAQQDFPFALYAQFLRNHADWPDKNVLQRRAEGALGSGVASDGVLVEYFRAFPPLTDRGKLIYIGALIRHGDPKRAKEFLKEEWGKGSFDALSQAKILDSYGPVLSSDDHARRVDNLLWQGNLARAENILSLLSGTTRRAAEARLRLQQGKGEQDAVKLVQAGVMQPGLVFEVVRHYRKRDQNDAAMRLLTKIRDDSGQHDKLWWQERSLLARRALEGGVYARAYQLASTHSHVSVSELADAEFLAGWLAVTRLNQPKKALAHFERMAGVVKTPISVARAAYWAGYAATAMKQKDLATRWYKAAAKHMNTFYGQMAAYALGNPERYFSDFLMRNQGLPRARNLRPDLVGAARALHQMGRDKDRDNFLQALINDAGKTGQAGALTAQVATLARELNAPRLSLLAAKAAYDRGYLASEGLFPSIAVPRNPNVDKALALAIIRQESQFDPRAQSPANVRGLMQLLPGTAAQMARQCAIPYRDASQLFLPQPNLTLGQAYIERMLSRYNQFVPLAVAAYNAGPGNVDNWLAAMGDPRRDPHSWVDWAERIPFYETRNYVQRVWESYSLYKVMLK